MMTSKRQRRISKFCSLGSLVLLFAVLGLLLPATARGQAGGAINGTVRDSSGGVIPDATVVLHNRGTNLDRNASTNSAGFYALTNIQPGEYDLTVSKDGFKTSQRSDVTVDVNQTSTIDYTLDPGTVQQTVTVQATVAALETSTSELGVAIVRQEVNNLPLNGRNFTQLLDLTPGVSTINVSQNGSLGGVWSNPVGIIQLSVDQRTDQPQRLFPAGRREQSGLIRQHLRRRADSRRRPGIQGSIPQR